MVGWNSLRGFPLRSNSHSQDFRFTDFASSIPLRFNSFLFVHGTIMLVSLFLFWSGDDYLELFSFCIIDKLNIGICLQGT